MLSIDGVLDKGREKWVERKRDRDRDKDKGRNIDRYG